MKLLLKNAGILAWKDERFDYIPEGFLGIDGDRYAGGRLENYVDGDHDRSGRLDALARKIHNVLPRFERIAASSPGMSPYELAIRLEEEIGCWKQP